MRCLENPIRFIDFFLCICCVVCPPSCSVIENREPCPCFVRVFPDDGRALEGVCRFFSFPEAGPVPDRSESLRFDGASAQERMVTVPKGNKILTLLEGLEGMAVDGNRLVVRPGKESDRIRCWSAETDCSGESASFPVRRTKHYATVLFSFEKSELPVCRYRVLVRGFFCGLDMRTLEPIAGDWSFMPQPLAPDAYDYSFRVPRQRGSGLVLELLDGNDLRKTDEILLGKVLEKAGYDWNKAELDDVQIVMDHVLAPLEVNVIEWKEDEIETVF